MKQEIKSLTSLRGIAAFMVLIFHVRWLDDWTFAFDDYTSIFSRGYLWVDFFFVLSGFIMSYVYGSTFSGAFGRADYLDFLRRRLLRIYPLHLVTLLLFVPLAAKDLFVDGDANHRPYTYAATFVHNVFLIQAWSLHGGGLWNGPSWSISAEWAAYLLFPVFFFLIYRLSARWAGALVLFGLVGLYVLSSYLSDQQHLDLHHDYGVLRCFVGFNLGILVYRVYEGLRERDGGESVIARDPFCLLVFALIPVLLHAPVHDIWLLPVFALLILVMALNRGVAARALETPMLYSLGLISYSLYMTHWFVYTVTGALSAKLLGGESGAPVVASLMVGAVVATIALSVITYRCIEQPFRRWPWWRLQRARPAR